MTKCLQTRINTQDEEVIRKRTFMNRIKYRCSNESHLQIALAIYNKSGHLLIDYRDRRIISFLKENKWDDITES